jgi:hypothetical protein
MARTSSNSFVNLRKLNRAICNRFRKLFEMLDKSRQSVAIVTLYGGNTRKTCQPATNLPALLPIIFIYEQGS